MPRLSLGLGAQNIRKVKGGAAPSGLPVASTSSIVVVGSGGVSSGTYNAQGYEDFIGTVATLQWFAGNAPFYSMPQVEFSNELYFFLGPNASLLDAEQSVYWESGPNWEIARLYEDQGIGLTVITVGTNPSTNADYIPTSGWNPSITITAA